MPPELPDDPSIELLVHVAAPTNGAAGDDKYRAQAAGILSFDAAEFRRVDLVTISWPPRDVLLVEPVVVDNEDARSQQSEEESARDFDGCGNEAEKVGTRGHRQRKRSADLVATEDGSCLRKRRSVMQNTGDSMSEIPKLRRSRRLQGSTADNESVPPTLELPNTRQRRRRELLQQSEDAVQDSIHEPTPEAHHSEQSQEVSQAHYKYPNFRQYPTPIPSSLDPKKTLQSLLKRASPPMLPAPLELEIPDECLAASLEQAAEASPSKSTNYGSFSSIFDSLISSIPDSQPPTRRSLQTSPTEPEASPLLLKTPQLKTPSQRIPSYMSSSFPPTTIRRTHISPFDPTPNIIAKTPSQPYTPHLPSTFPTAAGRALQAHTPKTPLQRSSSPSKKIIPTQSSPFTSARSPQPARTPPPPSQRSLASTWDNPFPSLLLLSVPPPRASSLPPLPTSPLSPTTNSISTLCSPTRHLAPLHPFSPFSPLPSLVPPPYTILSPAPAVNSNPPMFPPEFAGVLEQLGVFRKYEALRIEQKRELRKWERGFWKVDLWNWSEATEKVDFWNHVGEFVAAGRAGMVTVCLESEDGVGSVGGDGVADGESKGGNSKGGEAADAEAKERPLIAADTPSLALTVSQDQKRKRELERRGNVVRVFCFGGAAECVWGMLFAYSNKRMHGAEWIDAGGQVVVRF